MIVTCEKPTGSSLVIAVCAKAEKEVAANKQESADLIIMGLSDLQENKRAGKTNLNGLVSICLTLRLFEILVYSIENTSVRNIFPDFGDINYCLS